MDFPAILSNGFWRKSRDCKVEYNDFFGDSLTESITNAVGAYGDFELPVVQPNSSGIMRFHLLNKEQGGLQQIDIEVVADSVERLIQLVEWYLYRIRREYGDAYWYGCDTEYGVFRNFDSEKLNVYHL